LSILATYKASRWLAVALVALTSAVGAVRGADTATSVDAKMAAAKERAKKPSPAELRKLYEDLTKQRDTMIAEFDKLAKQMKDATEEKKKEIRDKLEEQKKKFDEVTNALLKQIRDEQRKQRQNAPPVKR
jgi:DNA anti-recombination protein RmuC